MTAEEELERVRLGTVEPPPGDADTLRVACGDDAGDVLGRVRQVLEVVLPRTEEGWPTLDQWTALLPAWFVAVCSDDVTVQSCVLDRWSLRAWTYWFQPGRRQWRWWDGRVAERDRLRIVLLVGARPYLRGALDWLLRASGATEVAVA